MLMKGWFSRCDRWLNRNINFCSEGDQFGQLYVVSVWELPSNYGREVHNQRENALKFLNKSSKGKMEIFRGTVI